MGLLARPALCVRYRTRARAHAQPIQGTNDTITNHSRFSNAPIAPRSQFCAPILRRRAFRVKTSVGEFAPRALACFRGGDHQFSRPHVHVFSECDCVAHWLKLAESAILHALLVFHPVESGRLDQLD